MKRIKTIALFAIANFAMAGMSFAQDHAVRATIPFDFAVGSAHLPAGTYSIREQSSNLIRIRNLAKPVSAFSVVNADGKQSGNGGKLIFHKYGSRYFLSEVLCTSEGLNVEVPPSKLEKTARLQETAAVVNQSNLIFVAAR
jgi:hypothetical protein